MSLLLPTPCLDVDEQVAWHRPASLTLRTAVGGTLYVTNGRLIFVPNRLNYGRSRKPRAWPRDQVAAVEVRDRDFTPYTGGMHNRFQVTLKNGEQLLFVVKDLETVLRELQNMLVSG